MTGLLLEVYFRFVFLSSMQVYSINCGFLKVLATEMVKPIPEKEIASVYPVDRDGCLKLSMRALLVVNEDRKVLIDPGTADFLPRKLREEYGLEIHDSFEADLRPYGVEAEQITDVIFTHLHFDHASGAFRRIPGNIVKRFPHARYHVLKAHYMYAMEPDPQEEGSFASGLLKYLDRIYWLEDWDLDWMSFQIFNGHTRGMVVPVVHDPAGPVFFVSDLVPMEIFLVPEVWCGYDLEPQLLLQEKAKFLEEITHGSRLYFYHDVLKESIIYQ